MMRQPISSSLPENIRPIRACLGLEAPSVGSGLDSGLETDDKRADSRRNQEPAGAGSGGLCSPGSGLR